MVGDEGGSVCMGGGGGGGTASVFWLKDRKTLSAGYMCSCDKCEDEYI